jgi:hypothetical protein
MYKKSRSNPFLVLRETEFPIVAIIIRVTYIVTKVFTVKLNSYYDSWNKALKTSKHLGRQNSGIKPEALNIGVAVC